MHSKLKAFSLSLPSTENLDPRWCSWNTHNEVAAKHK